MILSENDALEYAKFHVITKKDIDKMAIFLPSQTVLELCLGLIDCGYKIEDIRAMVDSCNDRRLNQFPWHLLNEGSPYFQARQQDI